MINLLIHFIAWGCLIAKVAQVVDAIEARTRGVTFYELEDA